MRMPENKESIEPEDVSTRVFVFCMIGIWGMVLLMAYLMGTY